MSNTKEVKKTILLADSTAILNEAGQWRRTNNVFELDDEYLYIKSEKIRHPLISSHALIDVMGLNQWNSVGKAVLSLFGLLQGYEIDPYYTVRGSIVEHLADAYIADVVYPEYKGELVVESFELSDFAGFNQFPHKAPWSGAIDKGITAPFRQSVEIKSKGANDINWIKNNKNYPELETVQGEQLARLWDADSCLMVWGFIPKDIEKYIRDAMADPDIMDAFRVVKNGVREVDYGVMCEVMEIGMTDLEWAHNVITVNNAKLNRYADEVLGVRQSVIDNRRIPLNLFTAEEVLELKDTFKK